MLADSTISGATMLSGRYVFDREIGRWELGPVWLGVDTVLDRPVELKQVGLCDPESSPEVARAEREAHLTARVHHEHVVAVFDLVEEGGHHWLVTEHVEGHSLATLIGERGTIASDDLTPLLEQVSDALAAAHEHGVVHRSVGPATILIAPDGSAKLTDFGAATGATTDAAPHDVWSLGRTAYVALSGHAPDGGSTGHLDGSDPLTPIVEAMLRDDPKARPTMAAVHRAALDLLPDDMVARPARTCTDWRTIGIAAGAALILSAVVALGSALGGKQPALDLNGSEAVSATAPVVDPDAVLEGFLTDYLTAASNDPAAGFEMLTPAFQKSTGGLGDYEKFWGSISALNVDAVRGDAADMTVSYTYSFDRDGDRDTKDVTIQLVEAGGSYLIAGTA